MTEIREATAADAATIQQLAEATWWPTYGSILSPEQLRYMLDTIYDLNNITRQITGKTQTYLLLEDGVPKGFASYSPRTENPDVYKLQKLYCLTETKGRGFGKMLLQKVEQAVKEAGKNVLELNVNRYNTAKNFYEKMGFHVAYEEDIDIGSGYWMNDFVMRKELAPPGLPQGEEMLRKRT